MNVRITDIIGVIRTMLKKEFQWPVHSDEILEGFSMPCFFIKAVPVTTVETLNTIRTSLTIVITYFASRRNQEEYMAVEDRIRELIDVGFSVGKRFIHVDGVTDTRTGEHEEILQIEVELSYTNKTQQIIRKIAGENNEDNRVAAVEIETNYREIKEETHGETGNANH